MTGTVLIDDHNLLRVLLGDEPDGLRAAGSGIATTGLWYHRLCRAVSDRTVAGAMSRRLGGLDKGVAAEVTSSIVALPSDIELLSLRALGWPMGELASSGVRLNLLSLEALAAARHLDAEICLAAANDNGPLIAAARTVGVPLRRLPN
ncbi:MAG: hypothetical protein OXG69_17670 [bacterium]|nr:hypothetical protein [bacterium]